MPDALVIALAVLAGASIGGSISFAAATWFIAGKNADRRDRAETFTQ